MYMNKHYAQNTFGLFSQVNSDMMSQPLLKLTSQHMYYDESMTVGKTVEKDIGFA